MATPCVITEEAKQYIIDHCTLTSKEIKKILSKEYDVDVSEVAIWKHLKAAREKAEEATRTADAHLSATIAERVNQYSPRILGRYEQELERIESVLDGSNNEFVLPIGDDGTRDKFWYEKYLRLYNETSKIYLSLRPPIQTIRIESAIDPDVAAIESWTDEQIKAFESFKKSLNKQNSESS